MPKSLRVQRLMLRRFLAGEVESARMVKTDSGYATPTPRDNSADCDAAAYLYCDDHECSSFYPSDACEMKDFNLCYIGQKWRGFKLGFRASPDLVKFLEEKKYLPLASLLASRRQKRQNPANL